MALRCLHVRHGLWERRVRLQRVARVPHSPFSTFQTPRLRSDLAQHRITAELKAGSHATSQVTLKLWLGVPVSPFPFLELRGQASRASSLSVILVRRLSLLTAPNPGPVWHTGVGRGLANPCRLGQAGRLPKVKFLELSTAPSLRTTCWQSGRKCLWCPAFAQPREARSSDCCKLSSLDLLSKKKKKGLLFLYL